MDNPSFVASELEKGNDVYLIDNYDNHAFHFDPKMPLGKVAIKARGGREVVTDELNPDFFESYLYADVVTRKEYLSF